MVAIAHLFSRRQPACTGLDISASGLRLASLSSPSRHVVRLDHYGGERLPEGAVVDGNIDNLRQVIDAARRLLERSDLQTRRVALGIPSAAVTFATLRLPSDSNEQEMADRVAAQAGQFLPFPPEQACIDFAVLGPVAGAPDEIDLLVSAVRKDKIEDRLAVLEAVGMHAVAVDIDTFAAHAALRRQQPLDKPSAPPRAFALLQVHKQGMHLSVRIGERVRHTQEQAFHFGQLTQDVMDAYALSREEAEHSQRSGDLPGSYATDMLAPHLEHAAREAAEVLRTWPNALPCITRVILCGEDATLPALAASIRQQTLIATATAASFASMLSAPGIDTRQLAVDAPAYLVACGLALRCMQS